MKSQMLVKILILLLVAQVGCSQNKQEHSTAKTEEKSNVYTLDLTRVNKFSSTGIDLRNKSQFREIENSETELIVLTGFSSFQLFKQSADNSWTEISLSEGIYCLDFLDGKSGWAVDWKGGIWQTVDGAKNWNQIGKLSSNEPNSRCEAIQFTSSQTGWLADFTGLFKTSDGGKTWQRVSKVTGDVANLFFVDQKKGWVTAIDENNNTTIYSTSDGGVSWKINKTQEIAIEEMFLRTLDTGWMIGKAGTEVYSTKNNGETLEKTQGFGNNFIAKSIFCLDNQTCFVAGYTYKNERESNPSDGSPALFKTVNDGQDWIRINIPTNEHFFEKIKFFNSNFGILAAQHTLYKTYDGGNSWNETLKLKSSQ